MAHYAVSIVEIALINVALSGDNAVVIALVAHRLPGRQRRRIILWGGALAMAMQAAFTAIIARLLLIPGLRLLGALLLLGIAAKLIREEDEVPGDRAEATRGPRGLIARIALANLAMSLDNVLAVASICRSDPLRMALGLLISGLVLFAFSAAIGELMARYWWIAYAGASVLAATAAGMIWHDMAAAPVGTVIASASLVPDGLHGLPGRVVFTLVIVLACLGFHRRHPAHRSRAGEPGPDSGAWDEVPFRAPGFRAADQATD